MEGFRKILFPVDFSGVSPKIVPWVDTIAKQFESEVHMLFVARSFQYLNRIYVDQEFIKKFENESLRGAQAKIQEFAKMHFDGYLSWKTNVILGDPAEDILSYIKSKGIDLVIIGTHSRNGLDRILFGSVAERVVKASPVPVLSINPYKSSVQ